MSVARASAARTQKADSAAAVEMQGVSITFRRRDQPSIDVVTDITLAVPAGATHCIAGRSGSGKTSLLRVAVALARPSAGTVRWFGRRVDRLTAEEIAVARRDQVSYVDQDATVVDQLTVLDNVLLPAIPRGIDAAIEDRARELLGVFGLSRVTRHRAATLSGGERQRVALARALLLRPGLVAVDEPTASLDRASADTVIDALRFVAQNGAAVLTASHDSHLIAAADALTRLD